MSPFSTRTRDLQRDVRAALAYAPVCGEDLTVVTRGRTVVLRGSVHSEAERDIAERAAWALPAVAAVENLLIVEPLAQV